MNFRSSRSIVLALISSIGVLYGFRSCTQSLADEYSSVDNEFGNGSTRPSGYSSGYHGSHYWGHSFWSGGSYSGGSSSGSSFHSSSGTSRGGFGGSAHSSGS